MTKKKGSDILYYSFFRDSNFVRENPNIEPDNCVPVLELDELIKWGELEQANNNIYRKSTDELNEDWIEKIKKLKGGLNGKN